MKHTNLLKHCMLFSELDSTALGELERAARIKKIGRGDVLFNEGDDAHSFCVVVSGSLDLVKSSPDGKEQLVRHVKKGEIFAEAAMFSGIAYPVTAVAKSKTEVLSIKKTSFLKFIKLHPDVSLKMMGVMSNLMRHLNSLLADLSLGTVSSRLAEFLLRRSKEEGSREFLLGMKKRELAFKLGTIPETLSRNLSKMVKIKALSVRRDKICIKNINRLESLAGR